MTEEQAKLLKSISHDITGIEKLVKSVTLGKADDEMEENAEAPATDEMSDAVHAADEGQPEETIEEYVQNMTPEEIDALLGVLQQAKGMSPDMEKAEGDLPIEGDEQVDPEADALLEGADPMMDEQGGAEDIKQQVAELSDEEREMLMRALEEYQGGVEQAPAEGLQQSELSNQMTNLTKSIQSLANDVRSIKAEQATLKKSVNAKRVEEPSRVIDQSTKITGNGSILKKSDDQSSLASRFTGETLARHILSQQRENRLIKSVHVSKANLAKSEDEILSVIDEAKKLGVKFDNLD